jgi:hypothetical protein
VELCTSHDGWSTMDGTPHGPHDCGHSSPYFQYENNSAIPWKILQFYKDTPELHHFSILFQIMNKLQLQPTIFHLDPWIFSKLHFQP